MRVCARVCHDDQYPTILTECIYLGETAADVHGRGTVLDGAVGASDLCRVTNKHTHLHTGRRHLKQLRIHSVEMHNSNVVVDGDDDDDDDNNKTTTTTTTLLLL